MLGCSCSYDNVRYYGLADVYLNWAKANSAAEIKNLLELKRLAMDAINEALRLAQIQGLLESDKVALNQKLQEVSDLP